jgi:hypothetical protein
VFGLVEGMFFEQATFTAFSANKRTAIQDQLMRFYNQPTANSQEIEYKIEGFTFNASAI